MIIDQLPLLGGDVQGTDEFPIERGTTTYKTTQAALIKTATDAAAAAQAAADNANAKGLPPGGTAGQVLTKADSSDYSASWEDPSGGDVTADMLGIVINGNSTPVGASLNQYVIVKDSTISGRPDGLYKAAKTIPANTAIDSTYLTEFSGGGFNELKSAYEKWMFPKGTTVNVSFPTSGAQYTAPSDGNLEIRFYNGYLLIDGSPSVMTRISNWSGATAPDNSTVIFSHMKKGANATVWRTATISNAYFTPCG